MVPERSVSAETSKDGRQAWRLTYQSLHPPHSIIGPELSELSQRHQESLSSLFTLFSLLAIRFLPPEAAGSLAPPSAASRALSLALARIFRVSSDSNARCDLFLTLPEVRPEEGPAIATWSMSVVIVCWGEMDGLRVVTDCSCMGGRRQTLA